MVPIATPITVIACDKRKAFAQGSVATKQSIHPLCRAMDCFASLAMTAGLYLRTLKKSRSSVAASVSPTDEYTSGTWWQVGWAKNRTPESTAPPFGSVAP